MKDEAKKSPTRIKKEEVVEKLSEEFAKSRSLIFWDYSGLTVPQFQQLREQLSQTGAKTGVVKNTLISFTLKNSGLGVLDSELLQGPTAIIMASDEIESLKILANFIKGAGLGKLKFGFIKQKFADSVQLEYLATLPSHQAIMGQIANLLYTPVYNLTHVLEANLRNLVYVLSARG